MACKMKFKRFLARGGCTLMGRCTCQVAGRVLWVRSEPRKLFTQVAEEKAGGWDPSDWQHPIHVIKSALDLFLVENVKQSKFRLTSMWRSFPFTLPVNTMGVKSNAWYESWHERSFSMQSWCISTFTESWEFYDTALATSQSPFLTLSVPIAHLVRYFIEISESERTSVLDISSLMVYYYWW